VTPRVRGLLGWRVASTLALCLLLAPAHAALGQAHGADGGASGSAPDAAPVPQVNLNTATVAELQGLPGVGPSRAEAIVAYRERRPFRRIEELMRIRGIGRKTFRRLRPMLTLEPPAPR
jgi:competence protein ComEA